MFFFSLAFRDHYTQITLTYLFQLTQMHLTLDHHPSQFWCEGVALDQGNQSYWEALSKLGWKRLAIQNIAFQWAILISYKLWKSCAYSTSLVENYGYLSLFVA